MYLGVLSFYVDLSNISRSTVFPSREAAVLSTFSAILVL